MGIFRVTKHTDLTNEWNNPSGEGFCFNHLGGEILLKILYPKVKIGLHWEGLMQEKAFREYLVAGT